MTCNRIWPASTVREEISSDKREEAERKRTEDGKEDYSKCAALHDPKKIAVIPVAEPVKMTIKCGMSSPNIPTLYLRNIFIVRTVLCPRSILRGHMAILGTGLYRLITMLFLVQACFMLQQDYSKGRSVTVRERMYEASIANTTDSASGTNRNFADAGQQHDRHEDDTDGKCRVEGRESQSQRLHPRSHDAAALPSRDIG